MYVRYERILSMTELNLANFKFAIKVLFNVIKISQTNQKSPQRYQNCVLIPQVDRRQLCVSVSRVCWLSGASISFSPFTKERNETKIKLIDLKERARFPKKKTEKIKGKRESEKQIISESNDDGGEYERV